MTLALAAGAAVLALALFPAAGVVAEALAFTAFFQNYDRIVLARRP